MTCSYCICVFLLYGFREILAKNKALETIREIAKFLDDAETGDEEKEIDIEIMNPSDSVNIQYAPLVSCDVERTFSSYKSIYRDNRKSFLFENLKKYVFINVNKNLLI